MSEFTIYHNPRCSKSRATLALLEENGVTPLVVLYLEDALSSDELGALFGKLNTGAGFRGPSGRHWRFMAIPIPIK